MFCLSHLFFHLSHYHVPSGLSQFEINKYILSLYEKVYRINHEGRFSGSIRNTSKEKKTADSV